MGLIVAAIIAVGGLCSPAQAGDGPPASGVNIIEWALLASFPAVLWWLWRADVIRPSSLSRRRARYVDASPWSVWWIGALLMLVSQAAGGAAGISLVAGSGEAGRDAGAALAGGIAAVAVGVWLMVLFRTSPWGERAGLDLRPRLRDLVAGLLGLLLVLPIIAVTTMASVIVAEQLLGRPTEALAHETLKVIFDDPWSLLSGCLILAAAVLAPVGEEILFRALVQSGLLRLSGRPWLAVLAASAVFASVHISAVGDSLHALAPLFVLGVCLGVAYERTGRLWVPITMHAAFNAANIGLTLAAT